MIFNALNSNETPLLTLIMPVLNDGVKIIPSVCTLAFTVKVPLTLIIVYDSPHDPTVEVINDLKSSFNNISLIKNEGIKVIGAITTGIKYCKTDVLGIWIPYHIDPYGLVNKMYDLITIYDCSLVSGNRFNKVKRISRGSAIKKLVSRGGNYILNRLIGVPLGDITTSIKLYKLEFIRQNNIETKINGGWAFSTELSLKAAIKGYPMGEVEFKPENTNIIHGVTNFKVFKYLGHYIKLLFWGITKRKTIKNNYSGNKNFFRID